MDEKPTKGKMRKESRTGRESYGVMRTGKRDGDRDRIFRIVIVSGAALLLALMILDLFIGEIAISPAVMLKGAADGGAAEAGTLRDILLKIRLPRVITAVLAGASLSLAGIQMQSIFRNPLADPHIMGVSSGAALGAAAATLAVPTAMSATVTGVTVAASAFAGAAAASALMLAASARLKGPGALLICGVMTGFIINALISLMQYNAGAESLRTYYSWAAGGFTGIGAGGCIVMAVALATGIVLSGVGAKRLDVMLFGDEYAALSGVRPGRIRFIALLGSSLMTGCVTAFCGPIGFVGIVAPHIARRLTRSAMHRKAMPASMVTGAILCVTADMLSQGCGTAVPAGSMMALIGIPLILAAMISGRR